MLYQSIWRGINITTARTAKAIIEPIKKVLPEDCNNIYIMLYKLLKMMPNKAAALNPFITKHRYHVSKTIQTNSDTIYVHAKA